MKYSVLVYNNPPAYVGTSKEKAQAAFEAEVTRTQDGIGPEETIELCQGVGVLARFEKGELTEPTKVVFRHLSGAQGLIAIMPEVNGDMDPATCMSYMHIGQHSSCDPLLLLSKSTLAQPEEYVRLMAELTAAGYIVKPIQKMTYAMFQKRQAAIRRIRYDAMHGRG